MDYTPKIAPVGDLAYVTRTTLTTLGRMVREVNVENGWDTSRAMEADPSSYNPKHIVAHKIAELGLVTTEVAEAIEEVRHGEPMNGSYFYATDGLKHGSLMQGLVPPEFKPEGVPSELADIVIRVLDIADAYKIDLGAALIEKINHNATRGLHHGGKAL